jgi:cyclic beta-1,2-glucan synthetase
MNYSKGIRENGGQYTHAVSWYLMALIKAGYHDRAYRYFQMINPVNRTLDQKGVEKYCVEPYVIAADIYSSESFPGRGGWTWYTGSAGWFYRVGVQEILGIHKMGDKLKLDPKIPVSWDGFTMKYRYIETEYTIEVKRDKKEELNVDGKVETTNTISLENDGKQHTIVLTIK